VKQYKKGQDIEWTSVNQESIINDKIAVLEKALLRIVRRVDKLEKESNERKDDGK
jgi:hypothetical protein